MDSPGPQHGLTARELEIVRLLMRGCGTGEITALLNIHPQTVRNSTYRIGLKLGVSGRLKIVARAREMGIDASDHDGGVREPLS